MFERALQGYEKALGPDHTSTLNTVHNLGNLYKDQGKLEEAEKMLRRALRGIEKVLGPDHTSTLDTVNKFGLLYVDQGRLDEAEKMYERALRGYEKVLGPDHTSTLDTVNNFGLLYTDQGKLEEAEKMLRKALRGREKALGPGYISTLTTVNNLGLLYACQSKLDEAEKMYERALRGYENAIGSDQALTYVPALNTTQNLASLLSTVGKFDESRALYLRAKSGIGIVFGMASARYQEIIDALTKLGVNETLEPKASESTQNDTDARINDGDTCSEVSDTPSIFSQGSSNSSDSSYMGVEDSRQTVTQHVAGLLLSEAGMRRLYSDALLKFDENKFLKNHDHLLKKFFVELRMNTRNELQLQTVRFLRNILQRKEVTENICALAGPQHETESWQLAEKLQNLEHDREFAINQLLQEQMLSTTNQPTVNSIIRSTEEDEDSSSNSDKEDDDDEDEDNKIDRAEGTFLELEMLKQFLFSGHCFQLFKARLQFWVDPPTNITQALQYHDATLLQVLLEKRLHQLAIDQYAWMAELEDAGYTPRDIAELIFEQSHDSPWIFFQAKDIPIIQIGLDFHLSDCPHGLESVQNPSLDLSTTFDLTEKNNTLRLVQELCGIGGIAPASRKPESWAAIVEFRERDSTAFISFKSNGEDIPQIKEVKSRTEKALEAFCTAAAHAQTRSICCNSFTVLKRGSSSKKMATHAELLRIEMRSAVKLKEALEQISGDDITETQFERLQGAVDEVLGRLLTTQTYDPDRTNARDIMNLCALAVQFICIGFLSYNQAHIGPIHPFYLETPLRSINLFGSSPVDENSTHLIVKLEKLTCFGKMTDGPVMVFHAIHPSQIVETGDSKDLDLLGTSVDILDTWGPSQLVYPINNMQAPVAIKIGGGYLSPPDSKVGKYHWDFELHVTPQSPILEVQKRILVGAFVQINNNCELNEVECWKMSCRHFEELGVHRHHWESSESQIGFQAGQYFSLQATSTRHKQTGPALKAFRLEADCDLILQLLEKFWGVQVSFCTGIARRVPLRELVADVTPAFESMFYTRKETAAWKMIKESYDITSAFRSQNPMYLQKWFGNLPEPLGEIVFRIIRRILETLKHTGLDGSGKYLDIAWPQPGEISRCFRIRLEGHSSWASMLADSHDCVTFAYISSNCLEACNITCRGPNPLWNNRICLLETAVFSPSLCDARTQELKDGEVYYFEKQDTKVWFKVRREQDSGQATLVRLLTLMSIPQEFRQRILLKEVSKKRARLKERDAVFIDAEFVSILSRWFIE